MTATREAGEIYVYEYGKWTLHGKMRDTSDAEAVAKFFQRRDHGEYQFAYVNDGGELVEV